MFPERLDAPQAYDIAKAMMDGFNRHYRLFRAESARAKHRFETQDWHGQQHGQRERIEFYDLRVRECERRLEREFQAGSLPMEVWHQAKLFYIGLLVDHLQPELAETFFNSVTTSILHRHYYYNDFIFVRPAISTEYIEIRQDVQTSYRSYYPSSANLNAMFAAMIEDYGLRVKFADFERDLDRVVQVLRQQIGESRLRANFQVQVLSSLFFRNKGAYLVGKVINGKGVPSKDEIEKYKTALLLFLGKEYARRGWVQQYHIGALRNNNSRRLLTLGPDTGFDSIHDAPVAKALSRLLDAQDAQGTLPKTILYCLNPRDNEVLGTMIGNFQGDNLRGKMQFGSGWWFNDQKDGMERQMIQLAQLGLLSRFVGMLTDSRSFLSYTRHEYFRRVLCRMLGRWVTDGEAPADIKLLGEMVQNICFNNAKNYFGIALK